jgi:hypothetical protein
LAHSTIGGVGKKVAGATGGVSPRGGSMPSLADHRWRMRVSSSLERLPGWLQQAGPDAWPNAPNHRRTPQRGRYCRLGGLKPHRQRSIRSLLEPHPLPGRGAGRPGGPSPRSRNPGLVVSHERLEIRVALPLVEGANRHIPLLTCQYKTARTPDPAPPRSRSRR